MPSYPDMEGDMLRITIEIDDKQAAVTTSLAGVGAEARPPMPTASAVVDTAGISMAAATRAQNAGPAPTGPNPMAQAMTQATNQGAPLPFVGGLPSPGAPGATPADLNAGAAPGAVLEPAPLVVTEEDQQ